MTERSKPSTKLQALPGESLWTAMARELVSNPDSVPSLNILSAVNSSMKPRMQAVNQVVTALEDQLREDGHVQRAALQAAIQYWECECGTTMDDALLDGFKRSAHERMQSKRRQPPQMDTILSSRPETTDTGYQLGIHLEGLEGTWHRLWAIICLAFGFGDDIEADGGVAEVRAQFEEALGRPMSPNEWSALVAHAKNHHETVMNPLTFKGASDGA